MVVVRGSKGATRLVGATAVCLLAGCRRAPSTFQPLGDPAAGIARLGWPATVTMAAIVLVVTALLLWGAFRSGPRDMERAESERRGVRWVVVGGALVPGLILACLFGTMLATLHAISEPDGPPAATIRVTGHQWWWEVEYVGADGTPLFQTANELHVPVGRPVRLELRSADVIHSFWLPQIAGKTDLIPGRVNRMWLRADEAGEFRGQCAEFCGVGHAAMLIRVVAEPSDEYRRWAADQSHLPAVDSTGMAAFRESGCAACHRIAGTLAQGKVGPDLSHVGSRATLAAGILPNTPGALAAWLRSPDSLKTGALMPDLSLSEPRIERLVAFLEGLK